MGNPGEHAGNRAEATALTRQIGLWTATGIVATSMIGTGIVTITGFMAADLPSPAWILGLWIVGGIIALAGALSLGELGAMYPRAGGNYVFLYHGFGPVWGYLSGWASLFVGFSGPVAAAALGMMAYISTYAPGLAPDAGGTFALGPLTLYYSWGHVVGATAIVAASAFHYVGVRTGTLFQNATTLLKIALLIGIVIAGFLWGAGDWAHLSTGTTDYALSAVLPKAGVSLIFVMFAFSGWDSASYIAGEIRRPDRNIPLALLMGTSGVFALYLALNLLYIYALPMADMAGVLTIGSKSFEALFSRSVTQWTDAVLALSILSALSAFVFIGPRVYYAMARDGLFIPAFGQVHPRYGTPGKAIMLQCAVSVLLMFTGSFDQLLAYAGFCLMGFSTMAVVAVYVLRFRDPDRARPYRTWGYPVTPAIFIIVSLWMMAYTIVGRPWESLLGIGTVAAGLPVYWWYHRKVSVS